MSGAVQLNYSQPPIQGSCFQTAKNTVEVVLQVAIRVMFVLTSVLAAASAFPLTMHLYTLPIVGLGSSVLSGFFFPLSPRRTGYFFNPTEPVLNPVQVRAEGEMPPSIPNTAPRGLHRQGNNCAFNALIHLYESNPEMARFWRNPLTDQTDLETFINFFQQYQLLNAARSRYEHVPETIFNAFREFVGQREAAAESTQSSVEPMVPIVDLFTQFLNEYHPQMGDTIIFNELKDLYRKLRELHGTFAHFFRLYDQSVTENRAVAGGNTQTIREACSRVTAIIDPSSGRQMDADEILRAALSVLPPSLKMHIEIQYRLSDVGAVSPMVDQPRVAEEYTDAIPLPILDSEEPQSVIDLLNGYLRDTSSTHNTQRRLGQDGQRHEYPVVGISVDFVEPPPVLRFQVKRFTSEPDPQPWHVRAFPGIFNPQPVAWHGRKFFTPIRVSRQIRIRAKDGREQEYRLAGFVTHHGTSSVSGHYTAGKIVGDQQYLIDDRNVTHVTEGTSRELWERHLGQAYFLSYEPVGA